MPPLLFLALSLAVGIRFLWPGDIAFVNDEPRILLQAWEDFRSGQWARHGLTGSMGTAYGPFATWFYTTAFHITDKVVTLSQIKTAVLTTATIFSLYAFARLKSFGQWGWISLFSPYLWFYARDLWDNSFVVGLSALAAVATLHFEKHHKIGSLIAAVVLATCGALTHLMALPVGLAIGVVVIAHYRRLPRTHWVAIGLTLIACFFLSLPYLSYLWETERSALPIKTHVAAFFFPFYGARLLTAVAFEYLVGPELFHVLAPGWGLTLLMRALYVGSALAYPLFWAGLYLACKRWREHLFILALFFFSWALLFLAGRISHPHYYNGLWFAALYLICLALESLAVRHPIRARWIFRAWAGSLAFFFVALPIAIHVNQGSRYFRYGPTLNNLKEVAAEMGQLHPDSPSVGKTENSKQFWHALTFLRDHPKAAPTAAPKIAYEVVYSKMAPNGRIELKHTEPHHNSPGH